MYEADDPRSKLQTAGARLPGGSDGFAAAEYARFGEWAPQEVHPAPTWYARGQNFVAAYTRGLPGAVLERVAQIDEWMMVLPEAGEGARITAGEQVLHVPGHSLVVMPPGPSRVELLQAGPVLRVFSTLNGDIAARASNAAAYAAPHPHIPAFAPWPDPPGGFRVRAYGLDVAPQPGRFGRIFRCTTMMLNVLPLENGPRDITRLSPHHHEDFEQGSFALEGAFLHHIRWPWTADSRHWREDDHEWCPAPSIAVIPPPAIHTSAATESGRNQLIDIFSPPRLDFSKMQGWVLNADDYPLLPGSTAA
jgi:hypothetical protein